MSDASDNLCAKLVLMSDKCVPRAGALPPPPCQASALNIPRLAYSPSVYQSIRFFATYGDFGLNIPRAAYSSSVYQCIRFRAAYGEKRGNSRHTADLGKLVMCGFRGFPYMEVISPRVVGLPYMGVVS